MGIAYKALHKITRNYLQVLLGKNYRVKCLRRDLNVSVPNGTSNPWSSFGLQKLATRKKDLEEFHESLFILVQ